MNERQDEILEKLIEIDKHLSYLDARVSTLEGNLPESVYFGQGEKPAETQGQKLEQAPVMTEAYAPEAKTSVPEEPTKTQENILSSKSGESFEVQLGTKWFSRIGITALVIGIALFLIYSLQYFGPLGKVAIGYLAAVTLLVIGFFLEKKLKLYGQILFGGGVAVLYFTTYASYFFEVTKVMDSEPINIAILAFISLLYLIYILRYNMEVMAGIALSLVYITANLGGLGDFSLIMLTIFLTIAIGISAWKRWKYLFFGSLLASYLTMARWIFLGGGSAATVSTFYFVFSILTICFVMYAAGCYLIYRSEEDRENIESALAITLNSLAYFGLSASVFYLTFEDPKRFFLLAFAILNIALALVYRLLARVHNGSRAYLGVGVTFLILFIPFYFGSIGTYLSWLAIGLCFVGYGIYRGTIRTRAIGLMIMLLALGRLTFIFDSIDKVLWTSLFAIFAISAEALSILMQRLPLHQEEGDSESGNTLVHGVYAVSSVFAMALCVFLVVDSNYVTLAFGIIGFLVPLVGFMINDKYFRRAGLGLLLLATLKLFLYDLSGMDTIFRIISFIGLGVLLLIISFGYNKYKDQISRYI